MKRFWRLLAVALTLTVLAGCSGLSYEDLYSLPRATEDYYDLQEALNEVLEDGCDYLAPTSGARTEPVHMPDRDGDGFLEIPQTRQLAAFDDGSSAQWVIDWYGLEADGSCEREFTTFENFSENWYFVIPEAWNEGLTIKAADETTTVSTVSFYRLEDEESPQEIMTIYTLQGTERQTYAQEHSLTILLNDSETIFAVTLAAAEPWEGTVTMAQVSELFHYTRTGWSEETSAEQN